MFLVNAVMEKISIGTAALIVVLGMAVVFFGLILLMCVTKIAGAIISRKKAAEPAAAPVAAAAAPGAAAAAPAEEQTEFDVVLVDAGAEKIKVIKVVREVVSGLGLKEAKEFVEAAPKTIKEAVSKDEAKKIVDQFAAVGAKCEIK